MHADDNITLSQEALIEFPELVAGILGAWMGAALVGSLIMRWLGHDAFGWGLLFTAFGPLALPLAIAEHRRLSQGTDDDQAELAGRFDALALVDGSVASETALREALDLLEGRLTSLTLAAVVDLDAPTSARGRALEDEARARLIATAGMIHLPGVPVRWVVLHGRPSKALGRYARAHGIELVITAASRHRGKRRHRGDVLETGAPCRILVGTDRLGRDPRNWPAQSRA